MSFLGRSHGSAEKIRNFSRWLSTYVADNGDTMTCDEVIIISRISRSLPFFDTFLGDAFARFWETGRENDSTKISEGLLTLTFHWDSVIRERPFDFLERLRNAAAHQPWNHMDRSADIVAAGFAAAHAMVNQHSLGAALLGGPFIRGRGVSFSAGMEVLLLSLEANERYDAANSLVRNYSYLCRDIDLLVSIYLGAAGVYCGFARPMIRKLEANLN